MPSDLAVWSLKNPITDRLITPDTKPPKSAKVPPLALWGAPTQYLPATFMLRSTRDMASVRIDASPLRCGRHRISADQIDLRVLKCWYMAGLGVWVEPKKGASVEFDVTSIGTQQDAGRENPGIDGGGNIFDRSQLWLAPELLIKDDSLIDFDRKRQDNVYRFTGMPTDADDLQPIELRAGETKQMWVTVHVPENAPPGRYEGQLRVRAAKRPTIHIPLSLVVMPIKLTDPALDYMMYYDSHLTAPWGHITSSKYRTPKQMLAELEDMRAHGITNSTVPEPIDGDRPDGKHFDFQNIDRVIDLREQAGFPVRDQPLYWTGGPGMLTSLYKHDPWIIDERMIKGIERTVRAMMRWAKKRRIPEVFVYGVDEVQDAKLKSEIRAFKRIRRLGAKIMMAVPPNFHDYIGDLVHCANVQGDPHDPKQIPPRVIKRIHRHGGRIYNYGRPQTGECRPQMYRRNYGIDLYLSGMDGPWPYGYQCMSGKFQAYDRIHTSHGRWLNHPFSYPTTNGVIPTWGSQGWRAAVDDVRYATTLQTMVDAKEGSKERRAQAKAFLDELDGDANLDAQRRKCANHIKALQR